MQAPTAAMLLIGNELLSGKVQEANLIVLAKELRALGVRLSRVVMIEDVTAEIAREVSELSAKFDWVFTSGGVGPTHDDVTLEAVARAFAMDIERRAELASLLRGFYGEKCTEGHLRMADVPSGAELVPTCDDIVRAEGKSTPWPAILVRNVFVLPGIPEVFRMKLGAVRSKLRALDARAYLSHAVFTDMDEGNLKPLLDEVVAKFPDVEVGSYPAWIGASYRTKLTFDGRDHGRILEAADVFCASLPEGEPKRRE